MISNICRLTQLFWTVLLNLLIIAHLPRTALAESLAQPAHLKSDSGLNNRLTFAKRHAVSAKAPERETTNEDFSGYFWQITDIHYDANYSVTGNPNQMCHKTTGGMQPRLSPYGDYNCDSPWKLLTSAVAFMLEQPQPIDFILWTGDSIPHISDADQDTEKVNEIMHNVTSYLESEFPDIPIYPSIGNHDSWPAHQVPCCDSGTQYFNDVLEKWGWQRFLDEKMTKDFQYGGYYTKELFNSKLLLINLNSILWYKNNHFFVNDTDPAQHFEWLEAKLIASRKLNQKVYIMAHISPGYYSRAASDTWFYPKFNSHLVDILQKYTDIIVAGFFGHEHTDSFHVMQGEQLVPLFLAPAVTPMKFDTANNPSVRLYKYDTRNFMVLDYDQFYLDLHSLQPGASPKWDLEYKLTRDFDIPDASGLHMMHIVDSLHDFPQVLAKVVKYNSVSYNLNETCDEACKRGYYCSFAKLKQDEHSRCMNPHIYTRHEPIHITTQHLPAPLVVVVAIGAIVLLIGGIGCFIKHRSRGAYVHEVRYSRLDKMEADGFLSSDSEEAV